jgi:hypothetical protein
VHFYSTVCHETSFSLQFNFAASKDVFTMVEEKVLELTKKNLIVLKFLGFSSISFVNGKSVTKFFDVLCFLFALSCGFFFCYLAIINKDNLSSSKSAIADYGNFLMLIASIFVSMSAMCCSFIFRHKIWSIILTLFDVDEKV